MGSYLRTFFLLFNLNLHVCYLYNVMINGSSLGLMWLWCIYKHPDAQKIVIYGNYHIGYNFASLKEQISNM